MDENEVVGVSFLEQHFHPINRQVVFTPKVLRRIDRLGVNIEVYKITMRVKGLSSSSSSRVKPNSIFRLQNKSFKGSHLSPRLQNGLNWTIMFYVYILYSSKSKDFYYGHTTDL